MGFAGNLQPGHAGQLSITEREGTAEVHLITTAPRWPQQETAVGEWGMWSMKQVYNVENAMAGVGPGLQLQQAVLPCQLRGQL